MQFKEILGVRVDYYRPIPSDLRFLKSTRLMTSDLKAVHHVLFNSYDYPKPDTVKYIIGQIFGNGPFCCINWGIA